MYRCGAPLALRLIASDAQSSSSMGFISSMTSLLQFRETLLAKAESSCSAKRSLAAEPTPPSAHAPPYSLWRVDNKNLYRSSVSQWRNTRGHATTSKADEFNVISVEVGLARIDGYDASGFIVNDVQVEGPIMCYGDVVTLWRPPSRFDDLVMDSLVLLDLVKPVPTLLVVGCGASIRPLPPPVLRGLRERGMDVEVLDTVNAVATFNILNQEGRKVVGALLPLSAA